MHNYDWLITRLDAFIRKYYANKVIKGTLVFLTCLLFYILAVSVSEYYLFLPVWVRLVIVTAFIGLGLVSLIGWVVIPLSNMAKLGKVISHEQAAKIIGTHFPEVSDKLLNILQLKRHPDNNASRELAEASINQKIGQLSVVPISSAIDFSKNRKYLPFLLPLLLIAVFILVAAPKIFSESSSRLLQPTKPFQKPAPFQFLIKNSSLIAVRNSDNTITIETKGNALPVDVFMAIDGSDKVLMQALENHCFQYTFRNVTDNVNFQFYAAGYYSETYTLKIVQKPVLKAFKVQINYPTYTNKKSETRNSLGDMTLPIGTTLSWGLTTEHTDDATIHFGAGSPIHLARNATDFGYQFRFLNDTNYTISLSNKEYAIADSYNYQVQIIPDQYPVIQMQQFKDSVSGKQILLTGTVGDDYGINKVSFNIEVSAQNKTLLKQSYPLKVASGLLTTFQHYFDIESLNLKPGQKLSYFIEAWDNDGVHGSKASRSDVLTFQMYDEKEIDSAINENSKQINSGLSNSAEKTKQLLTDYKDMQTKMLQSENMDWEQQQSLQEMLKKQMELKTQIENVKQRFEEQVQQSEQKKYSDEVREKQKELEKQMDNLLNAELKEEMKKLQELMQKLNKEQAVESMKQMQQDNKLFKMDMQRMQELMKKLEMQMRMEDLANKMDELAKKENELSKATDSGKKSDDAINKEQKELKDKFDKAMKEDLKELEKEAKDTKQEKSLDEPKEKGEEAEKEMKQSEQNMGQKQKGKASKSQKKASEKMSEMAQSLRKNSGDMNPDQIDIDIKATRQILSNLIRLSFDQEDLMQKVKTTSTSSQAYITNQDEQNRLHNNSKMIRDSLFELSKRLTKLSTGINKETTDLEYNMKLAVDNLENRVIGNAVSNEQYVMTHTNNLALTLNEVLANLMQMQNESKTPGAGSCNKPGGKRPKPGLGQQMSDIITEQQQLGNAMQQMKQKNGKKPGGKEGEKPGQGNKQGDGKGNGQGGGQNGGAKGEEGENNSENGDAEQLARLAEQQSQLRRKIQELSSLLNSKGLGNAKELKEITDKMNKTETDLVNRKLTSELFQRQRDIETRLLETEKALRQQEQDDKRASNSAKEISRPVPPQLLKYLADQKQLLELYKTVPPQLKPYYRDMVEQYFQIIGNKK